VRISPALISSLQDYSVLICPRPSFPVPTSDAPICRRQTCAMLISGGLGFLTPTSRMLTLPAPISPVRLGQTEEHAGGIQSGCAKNNGTSTAAQQRTLTHSTARQQLFYSLHSPTELSAQRFPFIHKAVDSFASVRTAPDRFTPTRTVKTIFAPVRFAPVRLALAR
jgi:hypothetical protein